MSVRVLHTADWQIGKLFSQIPGDAGATLRTQRLRTVERIGELATERCVDAILVAGDVFETNAVSDETIRRTVNALSRFAGPWLLLPGNHDPALAESVWTRMKRLGVPDSVVILRDESPLILADGRLAVLPAPLVRRHDARDLTERFADLETPAGAVRVGLAHGSVANRLPEPGESHNSIADDRADQARLDYLALGDWHGTLEIAPRTWYSGTPEPDRFKDNNPGNVLLVEIDGPGQAPRVELMAVAGFRWRRLEVSVFGPDDVTAFEASLNALSEPAASLVVSLTIHGTVDLATHDSVRKLAAEWAARFHYLALDLDGLVARASDDDLDRIDTTGFVRTAIDRLRETQSDPSRPESAVAGEALQRLYLEYIQLQGD